MAKSAIYTANTSTQALAVGSTIALGDTVRRFGCNIKNNGNSINVNGAGYYNVNANFILTGTNAGTVAITMLKDGIAIEGAIASVTLAVGDEVTVGINAMVREFGCCMDNNSNISFVLSGTAETVTNATVVVEKV